MKIRSGFVSNSSSSSFIIFTTEENYNRALNSVHPFIKKVAEKMFNKTQKFCDKQLVVSSTFSDMGGNSTWDDFTIEYNEEIPAEFSENEDINYYLAFEKFIKVLKENKNEVIESSIDF